MLLKLCTVCVAIGETNSLRINVHSHIFDAVANVDVEPGVVKREEVRVADADLEYLPADLLRSDHEYLRLHKKVHLDWDHATLDGN